ncbi:MAG: hypothetical protein H7X83_08375 [Verrucomicrobia bacterium]|nr:hypothetical protein [Deltaproteobacteria bacterium]
MKLGRILAAAVLVVALACGTAMATPSTQIWIPSTDVKGFKDIHIDVDNYMRFSPKPDAGPNYYNLGLSAGVLPFENIKLEVGMDMLMTGFQNDNQFDNHPFYFNAKLGTPEDAFGVKGLPAFAIGAYNLGTYDKPEVNGASTRQNIVYGMVVKTLPVIGRLSAGGYYGSSRALATSGNPSGTKNNSGVMASWDRSMPEISDKLWLAVDYMSGNNANGEISIGGSWAFSKQVSLIAGVVIFNPFYNISTGDNGINPGGKPALTTQLDIAF